MPSTTTVAVRPTRVIKINTPTPSQLPLGITMDDAATLDNFCPRAATMPLLAALDALLKGAEWGVYVWGASGVGKSHLLQATAQACTGDALYLPLRELIDYPAEAVLEGCDQVDLVIFDDLEHLNQQPDWQEAIFHLFNRRRTSQLPMLFAADAAPAQLTALLPDLRSRLGSVPVYHLPRLSEQDLSELLRFRAERRGLSLTDEVLQYILLRAPREPAALMRLLDILDREALARSRAVTVPLISELRLLSPDP